MRETLEETGLTVSNPRLAWVENCLWRERHTEQHYVTVFIRCDLIDLVHASSYATLVQPIVFQCDFDLIQCESSPLCLLPCLIAWAALSARQLLSSPPTLTGEALGRVWQELTGSRE